MIKRTLHFGNPAYLKTQNKQLHIHLPETKEDKTVAIEDIGIIVLDYPQITLTHACMAALLENNVAIITSNAQHLPVGLFLPLDGNHVQNERFRNQIDASIPLKKNLWQQTIQTKIHNQAAVLQEQGVNISNMLHWAKSVRSGDPDNLEGRAAAYYWKNIFTKIKDFTRDKNGMPPNNLLNYGYAILRAIVARGLVSSGLLPTLGIFHRNKYNAYCLADDIMEPYRPYLDRIVLEIIAKNIVIEEITKEMKIQLLGIATVDIHFERATSPLMVGMQQTTASLAKCFDRTLRKIIYPQLPITNELKYSQIEDEEEKNICDREDDDLPF